MREKEKEEEGQGEYGPLRMSGGEHEFMTDEDYNFIRRFIQERSAILLEDGKQYLVESRLMPIARRLNLSSIGELVGQLRAQLINGLNTQVMEAMVTTETSFFRDHHPFVTLKTTILPDLIKRRQSERGLNIWCAATASGQEPYSVAMLLQEQFGDLLLAGGWKVKLLASDISQEMLARAREGIYNQTEVNRGLPATHLVKYFDQHGNKWQLKETIRRMVTFMEINLAKAWPMLPSLDLVLIRNVMIYFDVETKKTILGKIKRLLRPDGYLLLGGAETTFNLDESYQRAENLKSGFYQLVR
jgi:chemotaxis protein methyltransferase CheR